MKITGYCPRCMKPYPDCKCRTAEGEPTQVFWDWYFSPPIDVRKAYGDALEFTPYERSLQKILNARK